MSLQHKRVCAAIFLLAAISFVALAQKDDGCYPAAGALVFELTWAETHLGYRKFELASPGETYAVLRSSRFEGECWIETEIGWLRSSKVIPALPPTPSPTPTLLPTPTPAPTSVPACFSERRAYVAGHMNIRASHMINSAIVGSAERGDLFEVSESIQGQTYCWLNIGIGWMAHTEIVHGKMPLPRIDGDSVFVKYIRAGFDFLWEKSKWAFMYVADYINVITPRPNNKPHSVAWVRSGRVEIDGRHLRPDVLLATVLLHEACHMHQYELNPFMPRALEWQRIEFEKECTEVEIVFLEAIGEGDSWIAEDLRSRLSQSYDKWLEYVRTDH